ncbi:12061_t:CDS:2, partial [Ambispora gerdemannii]
METLERIRCVHCEDTRWKFFISLDALDTALDAIKNINVYDVFPECEWVIGNSGVQGLYTAPFLIIFHQGEAKAVCLDNLDVLILSQLFEANVDPDLSDHELDSTNLGLPLFNQVPDQSLTDALDIVRGAFSTKVLDIISSVAFKYAKKTIEQVHVNIAAENSEEIFMQAIDSISTDPQCLVNTRTSIENWKESNFKSQCLGTINVLNELSISLAKEQFFHVLEMVSLLKQLSQTSSYEFSTNIFQSIIQKYINRLPFNREPFKSCQQKITKSIGFLPKLVSQLAELNYDPRLYKLHQKLKNIKTSGFDEKAIMNFFDLLSDERFENEYYEKLWMNSRFIYLIRNSPIAIPRVASLLQESNITECPSYVPQDIQERLNEYRNKISEHENITMPKILNNIDEVIKFLSLWSTEKKYMHLKNNSISKNAALENAFESADALFYWNKEEKHIKEPWEAQTIKNALQNLEQWKRNLDMNQPKLPLLPISILFSKATIRIPVNAIKSKSVRTTPSFGQKSNNYPPLASNTLQSKKTFLARFDCIVGLLTSVNCIVAQDILRIMAKFPMALPLVMPDMEHENEYKLMLPLLTGPIIKWNQNLEKSLKTISSGAYLNYLSLSEPGASRGKPHTLSGSVELTWLIQETCSAGLWKSVMQPYYE